MSRSITLFSRDFILCAPQIRPPKRIGKWPNWLLILFLLALASTVEVAWAQQRVVSGKVLAENGSPLPGTNILLQGTRTGTVSGLDGSFRLGNLPAGELKLEFSFVGYLTATETITAGETSSQLAIVLKEVSTPQQEVIVFAQRSYPITKTTLDKQALNKQNLGQDFPFLLQFTPSVVTTSDAGAGIGYTGMRIRGSDPERTNVTINGIPLNDAESHGVFWVNMPDFASSVAGVDIQRGVGTSVNGAGAFGASVNIATDAPTPEAYAETNNGFGSFNTLRNNLILNTGTLGEKFSFYGRLSRITSDGFIDNAFVNLRSFYLSGKYQSKLGDFTVNIFSGEEVTFQAWNGVPEEVLREGNRTFNELAGYDNEIDNYGQDHYQLLWNKHLGPQWTLHAALHYTKGRGYFEQYRENEPLLNYNLPPVVLGSEVITNTDIVRRRWLDNDFYGAVYSINYRSAAKRLGEPVLDLVAGGGWNQYEGKHFGEVIWARFMSTGQIRHRYYDNDATKRDFNAYAKANWQAAPNLFLFGDLQIREVGYDFLGFDAELRNVAQTDRLTFFNPKTGARYLFGSSEVYATFGIGNREPNRNDYTESSTATRPRNETLRNLEIGYSTAFKNTAFAVNYYLMDYRNQLVLVGNINDVGQYTRTNIDNSYRMGVELQWKVNLNQKLQWDANATFSQNRIREFTELIDNFDTGEPLAITHQGTAIAFSPNLIAGSQLSYFPAKNLELSLLSKYVGEQFLDNTANPSRSIDAYFVNDLRLIYQVPSKLFKAVEASLLVNNILDVAYESNGYTFGFIADGQAFRQNYFYPQAGRHFLLGLRLRI